MRTPGVEPGSQAWEACMMPLHYVRSQGLKKVAITLGFNGLQVYAHGMPLSELCTHASASKDQLVL
jgi:hypothetical protein